MRAAGWLEPLELAAYDRFLDLQPAAEAAPPILLVRILEQDIREFGHPICDDLLAEGLTKLLAGGARAIGVDLYRDAPITHCGAGPTSVAVETGLADVVTGSNRIFMLMKFADDDATGTPPPSWLTDTRRVRVYGCVRP